MWSHCLPLVFEVRWFRKKTGCSFFVCLVLCCCAECEERFGGHQYSQKHSVTMNSDPFRWFFFLQSCLPRLHLTSLVRVYVIKIYITIQLDSRLGQTHQLGIPVALKDEGWVSFFVRKCVHVCMCVPLKREEGFSFSTAPRLAVGQRLN